VTAEGGKVLVMIYSFEGCEHQQSEILLRVVQEGIIRCNEIKWTMCKLEL